MISIYVDINNICEQDNVHFLRLNLRINEKYILT